MHKTAGRGLILALLMICFPAFVAALEITPLNEKTVAVNLTAKGTTPEEAVQYAEQQAVLASAGRILLDDKLIRADELMEKYLLTYAHRFVSGVEILDDQFTGGFNVIDARVFVDYQRLIDDLGEKRFVYSPAYKPMFTAFMYEEIDGLQIEDEVARLQLENALQLAGQKTYEGRIRTPPMNTDVAADDFLLEEAIEASERRNIELMISGTAITELREERKVYYDIFYFYDCEMSAQLIRVDTGEVLAEVTATGSASDRDRADAISTAIQRAAREVVEQLVQSYREFWPEVVQGNAEYELLLTGTDEELNRVVSQHMERLSRDTKVTLRKMFDKTALLVISTSADREQLLDQIKSSPYPTLTIIREEG